jgi:hypothetical protein
MHHVRLKFLDRGWKFKSRSERWTDGIIREFCLHVNLRYFSYIRMTCSNASNLLDERKSKVNARTKVSDITLNTFVDHLKLWVMDNQNSHIQSLTHTITVTFYIRPQPQQQQQRKAYQLTSIVFER